ncbi:hypothetical protein HBE96_17530 [Clostridium sp. P21]|uniref:SbsA Ig-like domain-containing protein n=1 Tax=Clostridium muellerianum TaxID=2716538 RepID=A0A7Y0EJ38_9CLOT|nr:Ig-like domain-containing protein [Clostridium muellerianum]NMM64423.1 hypothetical protein [Clostridium muellerianum]
MKLLKKISSLAISFIIFSVSIPVHASDTGTWRTLPDRTNIALDKTWTLTFNQDVTPDKIDGITIENEQTNTYIPVSVNLHPTSNSKQIQITPVNNYDSNTKYSLRLFLNNGKRIKLNFTTQDTNDLEYINFSDFQNGKGMYDKTLGLGLIAFNSSYKAQVRQKSYSLNNGINFSCTAVPDDFTYLLGKKMRKLTGYYASPDDISGSGSLIKICGDGKELLNVNPQRGDELIYFEIDVTGIDKLEFTTDNSGNSRAGVLYDLRLGYDKGTALNN